MRLGRGASEVPSAIFNSYRAHALSEVGDTFRDKWTNLSTWYQGSGADEFRRAFREETGISIGHNSNADALVATAVPRSMQDLERKLKGSAYYRSHGQWFIEEMDYICGGVPNAAAGAVAEEAYQTTAARD
jgi:hypothetical protein